MVHFVQCPCVTGCADCYGTITCGCPECTNKTKPPKHAKEKQNKPKHVLKNEALGDHLNALENIIKKHLKVDVKYETVVEAVKPVKCEISIVNVDHDVATSKIQVENVDYQACRVDRIVPIRISVETLGVEKEKVAVKKVDYTPTRVDNVGRSRSFEASDIAMPKNKTRETTRPREEFQV